MAKINLVSQAVELLTIVAEARINTADASAKFALIIASIFATFKPNDKKGFDAMFGNGEAPKAKTYVPGELATAARARIAAADSERQTMALNVLKTRLSECRKAFRAGLTLSKSETVQVALKRLPKQATKVPAGQTVAGNNKVTVAISDSATMEDIASALSIWVAKHGNAANGLASRFSDFLPVTVRRAKQA